MPASALPLVDRDDVRTRVEDALARVLAREGAVLSEISSDSAPLVDAWRDMLRGGKRLRAAFSYWSWRAHRSTTTEPVPAESVIGVGAALELFQAAALFHDDVMDQSDTRRGVPTAHRTFTDRHRRSGWTGDGEQFGLSSAILLGDLSLVASEEEFVRALTGLPTALVRGARSVFTRMRTEVTVGQYLDMYAQVLPWGADLAADESRAREVIRSKSARYSVECPILLGAALAGASEEALATCSAFGLPLGEAFQLRDDMLGVFGDPAVTGKPAGDDLREGKRTVLVIRTMGAVDDAARADIHALLGRPDLTEAQVQHLQEMIRASGAVEEVEGLIDDLTSRALDTLATADLEPEAAETLLALARSAVERTS